MRYQGIWFTKEPLKQTVPIFIYDWYVDSVYGSDSNDGLNPFGAFKTIAKLLTVWQPGESVGMASGSHWREEMVYPGAYSKVYAYGTGGTPILDASDVALNASFSKTAGQTNVYEITVEIDSPVGYSNWINIWEDDVNMLYVTSVANCDATPNSFYKTAESGTVTLYVHASDSSDVTANGKEYTFSKRRTGARMAYVGCHIEGIRTQKNLQADGSLLFNPSCTGTDCWAYFGSKHNVYYGEDCVLTRVHAVDANYNASSTYFVLNQDTPTGLGAYLVECTATKTQAASAGSAYTGFHGHNNVSGSFGTVNHINCTVTGMEKGFTMNNADIVNWVNCTTTGLGICGYNPRFSGTVYTIDGGTHVISGSDSNQVVFIDSAGTTVNIQNCTFTADRPNQEALIYATADATINFTDNAFAITATTGAYRVVLYSASVIDFTADGNTYTLADAVTDPQAVRLTNASSTVVSDNNTFSHAQIRNTLGGTTYSTVADWQAAGYDLNSTVL